MSSIAKIERKIIYVVNTTGCSVWIGNMATQKNRRAKMVFEKKVLRKIYGPVKDEITGEW